MYSQEHKNPGKKTPPVSTASRTGMFGEQPFGVQTKKPQPSEPVDIGQAIKQKNLITKLLQSAEASPETGLQPKREFAQGLKAQILQRTPGDSGVPESAQEEDRAKDKTTVICSMTPEGKIGSLYYDKGQRILTYHSSEGPEKRKIIPDTIMFNIDKTKSFEEFESKYPNASKLSSEQRTRKYYRWVLDTLYKTIEENEKLEKKSPFGKLMTWKKKSSFPDWATLLDSPDKAPDAKTEIPLKNIRLFEIIKKSGGELDPHMSRGTGMKFEIDTEVLSMLNDAIDHIDKMGLKHEQQRNREFYKFVKDKEPKFAETYLHQTP